MILTVEYYFADPQDKLGMYASDPEDNSHEHSHEFAELVIVDEGHGLHIINGRPLYIQQGDVFYVQPGDVHYYDELGTLKLINVLINPEVEFHYLQHLDSLFADLLFPAGLLLRLAGARCPPYLQGTGGENIFSGWPAGGKQGAAGSRFFPAGHDHNVCGNRS